MSILFGIGIGSYILFMRVRKFLNSKKEFEKVKEGRSFEVYDTSKKWAIFFIVAILFGIVGIVRFGFMEYSESNLAISIVVVLCFISEIFSAQIYRKVYYNNEAFFFDDKLIRYSNIKNFKKRNTPFATDVVLFSGDSISVPTKPLLIIQDLMVEQKNEKKKKKKEKK